MERYLYDDDAKIHKDANEHRALRRRDGEQIYGSSGTSLPLTSIRTLSILHKYYILHLR